MNCLLLGYKPRQELRVYNRMYFFIFLFSMDIFLLHVCMTVDLSSHDEHNLFFSPLTSFMHLFQRDFKKFLKLHHGSV